LRFLPGDVAIEPSESKLGELRVRRISIRASDMPPARHLADIDDLIAGEHLPPRVRDVATGVYRRLAGAESRVHGSKVESVTFHEVGSPRSVIAVLGTALALDLLGIEQVVSSPLPTGSGTVDTEHGKLPVPTPATLELLRDVPLEPLDARGELVTPTGAAIVAEVASSFGPVPRMTVEGIGYGADDERSPTIVMRIVVGGSAPWATVARSETGRAGSSLR
jgi:uncharacterized protein (DUF111 family)